VPTKILKSIKGQKLRLTRLDECGAPDFGACGQIVTDGFISVVLSAEIEAGEEYQQKNANGDLCISERDADRFKWVNVTVQLCEIDPDTVEMIGGDMVTALVDEDTNTIGYAVNTNANFQSFALEVWTKVAGGACDPEGNPESGYFLVPWIRNGRPDGDITIENGVLTFQMRGDGFPATDAWDDSPYTANPLIDDMPVGHLWGQVTTTVTQPAVTTGCAALVDPDA